MEAATNPPPSPPRHRRRKQQKKTDDHTNTDASATDISELPSHITCDILSRLPLKSIFACKLVCPSFRNLTLDPHFPRLHLSRSPLTLILYRGSNITRTIFGFLPLNDSLATLGRRRATIKFNSQIEFPGSTRSIVSCCEGLICLTQYFLSDRVCIFNPLTRQHFLLPKPKKYQKIVNKRPHIVRSGSGCGSGYGDGVKFEFGIGFGYCPSTALYKVVQFTGSYEKPPHTLRCRIYTLGVDDKWRNLGSTGQPIPYFLTLVFFNGALHWISSGDSLLLLCYFDMEKEQCGTLPLPDHYAVHSQLEEEFFHLGVVDNCLYICDERASHSSVNIWVMKDYGNIGSWTLELIIQRPLPFGLDWQLKPVKTLENGTVLMIVKQKTLVSYNPATRVFRRISYDGARCWQGSIIGVPSFLPLP
ncbi:hypothetical protein Vadar_027848 [Vaccinium darrowii]|uniref:Uncharacterized protein n=1 Tax=Vaccinium darrowii TaxID=229202 RepID=A0ACB7XTJ5_9ERIC|nr:hypothetical protein Vadar_027848 [Vaccinium darrowii]